MNEAGLIYQAITKVMAAVGAIEKGRRNTQQNYAFRGIDDVFLAFQRPLAENGVFYVPEVLDKVINERPTKSGGVMIYTVLTVAYTFYASDGSHVRAVVQGEAMDSGDKSSNKAMSAALKYALLQIFCVPVEQEDADQETHELAGQTQPKPTAAQTKAAFTKGKPATTSAGSDATALRAELCSINQRLGYSDAKLLAWLIKRFTLTDPETLAAALASLNVEQLREAREVFRAKLTEQP